MFDTFSGMCQEGQRASKYQGIRAPRKHHISILIRRMFSLVPHPSDESCTSVFLIKVQHQLIGLVFHLSKKL